MTDNAQELVSMTKLGVIQIYNPGNFTAAGISRMKCHIQSLISPPRTPSHRNPPLGNVDPFLATEKSARVLKNLMCS